MSRSLIREITVSIAIGIAGIGGHAIAQTNSTTPATQSQSDYDRVMSGVNATTQGVVGKQPGTPAAGVTTTTKTVSGPFPLTTNNGIGVNGTPYNSGYNYGGYPGYGYNNSAQIAPAAIPAMPYVPPYTPPALPANGNSTTTTTTSAGTNTPQ